MIPILIDGPAVEPVSLSEMRAYLRRTDTAEDDLLAGLVKAARLMVEAASGRILVEQSWQLMLDRWPTGRAIALPLAPLIGIDRVRVFDAQAQPTDLPVSMVEADPASDPPRILVDESAPEPGRPARGILIDLRVGFGARAEDVPASLRLAVKIMVAHWFENRGDVAGAQSLPGEASALTAPFRRARL
jgi:uncharacterized phiE125 gp8 family phage protein